MKFSTKFYTGDYEIRQIGANRDKAIVYIEHHFNGGSATANYCLANIATNGSKKSAAIAQTYVKKISEAFNVSLANNDFAKGGVSRGGYKLRGNSNLFHTAMPAILLEPLFATNPNHSRIIKSKEGQMSLALAIVETVKEHFPGGGLVAFSVGHKGKTSKPFDRGVELYGGGNEADHAEIILKLAAEILEQTV